MLLEGETKSKGKGQDDHLLCHPHNSSPAVCKSSLLLVGGREGQWRSPELIPMCFCFIVFISPEISHFRRTERFISFFLNLILIEARERWFEVRRPGASSHRQTLGLRVPALGLSFYTYKRKRVYEWLRGPDQRSNPRSHLSFIGRLQKTSPQAKLGGGQIGLQVLTALENSASHTGCIFLYILYYTMNW